MAALWLLKACSMRLSVETNSTITGCSGRLTVCAGAGDIHRPFLQHCVVLLPGFLLLEHWNHVLTFVTTILAIPRINWDVVLKCSINKPPTDLSSLYAVRQRLKRVGLRNRFGQRWHFKLPVVSNLLDYSCQPPLVCDDGPVWIKL